MKRHLTEKQLLKYQFELGSDNQVQAYGKHLEGCPQCREHLGQLKGRFAALELLRDDTPVPEELILRATERAGQSSSASVAVSFRRYRLIGAVAAMLLVALALFYGPDMIGERTDRRQYARRLEPRDTAEGMPIDQRGETDVKGYTVVGGSDREKKGKGRDLSVAPPAESAFAFDAGQTAKEQERLAGDLSRLRTDGTADQPISEQAPFAPASAIELVTLPRRDKVQLTIYNSADLTLVREQRNLTLKRGWNWLQFMWANTLIDPTSLSLEPLEEKDKIDIEQLVFPARLRELGRWLIRSEISGQVPFEITYFTSGLSWRAFYRGTLGQDESSMDLQGYVRVSNSSGEDYEHAQTRMIVGKIHLLDKIAELAKRPYAYGNPTGLESIDSERRLNRLGELECESLEEQADLFAEFDGLQFGRQKEIKKEGLSEYFLYTIEGTETIADKWGKRLPSFDVEDIEVESLYKYDEERWGAETIRFVKFANDDEHNLGDTPIPDGTVKIYGQVDEQGHLSYVGGTSIKYIPVDEDVELNLGPARLVKVEPKLMSFETSNYVFDDKGNVAGWDETRTWHMEITNTRSLPIEIEITRGFDTAYWTLQTEMPYERHDAAHARFEMQLQARSKQTFTYALTTYHGRRQGQVNE